MALYVSTKVEVDRTFYFKKIGGMGRTDGRTDRQTDGQGIAQCDPLWRAT